jgi:glycosyltransferase involved in cell wall biosynthesis
VPELLKTSDIIVLSSHWEGFGLAAVEGMAAGKPTVASDVDGLREVVQGAGVLFPHGDAQALAQIIQQLQVDPTYYHDVAIRCYQRAQQFDIMRMVEKYEKVYESYK